MKPTTHSQVVASSAAVAMALLGCKQGSQANPPPPLPHVAYTADAAAPPPPAAWCTIAGAPRPLPALAGLGPSDTVAWTTFPDATCPTGTRDALSLHLRGPFYVGALANYARIGDICLAHQVFSIDGRGAVVMLHHNFPKDGDAVVVQYGTGYKSDTCRVFDTPPDDVGVNAVAFHGSCATAQPAGDLTRYQVRAHVRGHANVHVRSSAAFMKEEPNLIGELPASALPMAEGPLHAGDGSTGIGYAIVVQDDRGVVCRGYVSATVVEPV